MTVRIDSQLIGACVERAGWIKGPLLAKFCGEWAIAECELGHQVGPEEFSRWWKDATPRTAYRQLALLRKSFPELGPEATPRAIAKASKQEAGVVAELVAQGRPG